MSLVIVTPCEPSYWINFFVIYFTQSHPYLFHSFYYRFHNTWIRKVILFCVESIHIKYTHCIIYFERFSVSNKIGHLFIFDCRYCIHIMIISYFWDLSIWMRIYPSYIDLLVFDWQYFCQSLFSSTFFTDFCNCSSNFCNPLIYHSISLGSFDASIEV